MSTGGKRGNAFYLGSQSQQTLRQKIGRVASSTAIPGPSGKQPRPRLAKATGETSAFTMGTFRLQANTPDGLQDGSKTLDAYTTANLKVGDLVELIKMKGEDSGGYWLAIPLGSKDCCCDSLRFQERMMVLLNIEDDEYEAGQTMRERMTELLQKYQCITSEPVQCNGCQYDSMKITMANHVNIANVIVGGFWVYDWFSSNLNAEWILPSVSPFPNARWKQTFDVSSHFVFDPVETGGSQDDLDEKILTIEAICGEGAGNIRLIMTINMRDTSDPANPNWVAVNLGDFTINQGGVFPCDSALQGQQGSTTRKNIGIWFFNFDASLGNGPAPPPPQPVESGRKLRWMNQWNADTTYRAFDQVLDGLWLMVANKETSDRAAPQEAGVPSYDLPATPTWVEQTFTGEVYAGSHYTLTQPGWVQSVEVWLPELTANYDFRVIFIDITDSRVGVVDNPSVTAGQWSAVSVPFAGLGVGHQFQVVLEILNSASSTTFTGDWTRDVNSQNGLPFSGGWNRSNQGDVLRISKTDDAAADRSAELLSVIPGSTITLTSSTSSSVWIEFSVDLAPIDDVGTVQYVVTQTAIGPGGEPPVGTLCKLLFDIPVPSPTKYVEIANHWPSNQPSWATVEGRLRLGGVDQTVPDNAYGVRINFQPAYVSPDWDFASSFP